ncbi:hypothetical protein J6590_007399 [Homalodisca vitripennis]|nr:hypothetical protein J6590_007399 [Homalodisca vitripennis]
MTYKELAQQPSVLTVPRCRPPHRSLLIGIVPTTTTTAVSTQFDKYSRSECPFLCIDVSFAQYLVHVWEHVSRDVHEQLPLTFQRFADILHQSTQRGCKNRRLVFCPKDMILNVGLITSVMSRYFTTLFVSIISVS